MASTMTLVSATPYSLKYRYDADAASPIINVAKVTMIADLVAGVPGPSPLLALLQGITDDGPGDAVWDALEESAEVSLYLTPHVQSVGASTIASEFTAPLGAQRLNVTGVAVAALDRATVEVRFNHTFDR